MPVTSVPNSYARRVYETMPSDSTLRRRDVNIDETENDAAEETTESGVPTFRKIDVREDRDGKIALTVQPGTDCPMRLERFHPLEANQVIKGMQDAMGRLGHTTWMTPPPGDHTEPDSEAEEAAQRREALKFDVLVMNQVVTMSANGNAAPDQMMRLTGAIMAYYDTLPEGSPERTELQHQVTALHDAHSDLQTALQRITRACLHVREAINPTPEDDD